LTLTRLGTEFLPELDEGDIQLFVEMPPSVALEKGRTSSSKCGGGFSRFPK